MTETNNPAGGGELITYNPTSNLLDFDDEMLFDVNNLATENTPTDSDTTNAYYDTTTVDLEDSKALLYDSLTAGNSSARS